MKEAARVAAPEKGAGGPASRDRGPDSSGASAGTGVTGILSLGLTCFTGPVLALFPFHLKPESLLSPFFVPVVPVTMGPL